MQAIIWQTTNVTIVVKGKIESKSRFDEFGVWIEVHRDRVECFQRDMPMAMENLAITQHKDTLRFVCIRSEAYRPQLRQFKVGDYVYLQREAPTTLDVQAGQTILKANGILPRVFVLHGKDGKECRGNTKDFAPRHLPIEGTVDPKLTVVPPRYECFVCGKSKGATTTLLCDLCQ